MTFKSIVFKKHRRIFFSAFIFCQLVTHFCCWRKAQLNISNVLSALLIVLKALTNGFSQNLIEFCNFRLYLSFVFVDLHILDNHGTQCLQNQIRMNLNRFKGFSWWLMNLNIWNYSLSIIINVVFTLPRLSTCYRVSLKTGPMLFVVKEKIICLV